MKPLEELTNVDRAKLLHQLFPGEIKGFISFAIEFAEYKEANRKKLETDWKNQLFTFNAWLNIAVDAKKRMQRYRIQLPRNSNLFANQLFDGYTALWAVDTLLKYVDDPDFSLSKFKEMVNVLFGSSNR